MIVPPRPAPTTRAPQDRLDRTLDELRRAGLKVTGYVTEPDPFRSIMNALDHHPADEIVISTLPTYKSRWLRGDLIGKVRKASGRPVEHVISDPSRAERPAGAGVA